jgi:flagellar biosynthesis GTPase FlhF
MTDYDELAERLTSLNFNEDQKGFFLRILEKQQTAEKALQEEAEARQSAEKALQEEAEARQFAEKARQSAEKALQEEAEARQKAETKLTEIELNSIWQYFLPDGKRLPQLHQTGTKSGASTNKKHNPIKNFYSGEFGIIPLTENDLEHCKSVSASIQFTDSVGYSTEMDIQQLCKSFLENMIVASKVGLELRSDLSISELRADFWVISSNGFPVGAIEVKKPDGEDSNEETRKMHLGQLFDYLMRIRTFHGVRNLIGILTDFESWTILLAKRF